MAPLLFADRFVVLRPGCAIDLATGEVAWLRHTSFSGPESHETWLARCAALTGLWHPNVVPLVDFGAGGRSGYFEAWLCPAPPHRLWRRRDASTASALRAAASCLAASGVSAGRLRWSQVIALDNRPAVVPRLDVTEADGSSAGPTGAQVKQPGSVADASGVRDGGGLVEQVADVLDCGVSGRPRSLVLAVQECQTRPALTALARCARLRGYVPVSARLVADAARQLAGISLRRLLSDRHVIVLREAGDGLGAASGLFFLLMALQNDRPHVLLTVTAAGRARARASWPLPDISTPMRAREESAPYAAGPVVTTWTPTLMPARGRVDAARQTVLEAAASGRHAQVERWLRETSGRCARRQDDGGAGDAQLALGRLMMQRGQLAEASRAFAAARQHFEAARLADRVVHAGVFSGLVLTDGGRFCDAESALRAGGVAASSVGDERARAFATLGLARCLLWQGRCEEALGCLTDTTQPRGCAVVADDPVAAEWRRLGSVACARDRLYGPTPSRDAVQVPADEWPFGAISPDAARACLQVRAALAFGDLGAAGRAAAAARTAALTAARPIDLATVCRARALLFSALGDLPATRQQVDEGLRACRLAHDPLRALRLRMVLAETLLREGAMAEAKTCLLRLGRLNPHKVPAVVGRPLEQILRGGVSCRAGPVAVPFHHPTQAGPLGSVLPAVRPSLADTIIEVLRFCQSADDERTTVRKVAAALRGRLRAASVACAGNERSQAVVLASDGTGPPAEGIALRAIQSGLVIPPASSRTGLEAAEPIRFGGEVVGAIACRWPADSPPDWPGAGALLAAAATAVAPCFRALLDRRATPDAAPSQTGDLIGVSGAIVSLRAEIARAAAAPFPVLIEGESGSGKELVARAIHRLGPRASRPLCALNCAALTDELLEAELFGHARGAFTGAVHERKGLFEEAHQGTLVFDEVGELTPRAQAKLLRAIQEGEVRRLGENFSRAVEVRIVAATNRSLRAAVESGAFRQDLLYRLEVIRVSVPPLRARVEDVPVLAAHFWREATTRLGSRSTLAPATVSALARYDWPGNVRELQNVMAALAVSAGGRGSVGPERLPAIIARQAAGHADARSLNDARRVFEATFVRAALARAGGRRAHAAADLGLTRQGLAKLMARLGIEK
jgi:DNA-binding NtrC family response regulator